MRKQTRAALVRLIERAAHEIAALASVTTTGVIMLILFVFDESRLALALASMLIVTYAVGASLRLLLPKPRPRRRRAKHWFERIDAASFPSLHAARASALAILLAMRWPVAPFVMLLVVLVLLVSYARVVVGAHDRTDVLAGTLLGAGVAVLILLAQSL